MTDVTLRFVPFAGPGKGVLVVFCDDALKIGPASSKALAGTGDLVKRAAKAERFTGKRGSVLNLPVPQGLSVERLIVVGAGTPDKLEPNDVINLGGTAIGKAPVAARDVMIFAELPGKKSFSADQSADLALGARLRGYRFDRYKTKIKDGEEKPAVKTVSIAVADVGAARKAYVPREAIAEGVIIARDLVNEPANVLYPQEFARRASNVKKHRVGVDVLDVEAMQKLGMNALLGVGQGSVRDSRLVVMRWNGAKKNQAPVAFIGKGVCFDTGGISIKPAGGMEDMKGDMAGAACVVGLMHALARRKAKVNAVGIIGLVENMPDGNAQRPGDIVTSMSGQTIEIINTDAEGRLVLADALWYAATKFKPKFMVDLATLTGAIIVALGHEHAGLFSNDDKLAERLTKAGLDTGEPVWRMPLGKEYDKLIDSKFADVKNTGAGRWGGAITAAQFLQRFVANNTPWAHLDIAGAGFEFTANRNQQELGVGLGRSVARPAGGRALRRLMTEILFYHLQGQKLEGVLPPLLEKSLARGWRAIVQGGVEERIDALDAHLWTYRDDGFLPHGTWREAEAPMQPVLLTTSESNPNGAQVRFLIDGAQMPAETTDYQRIVLLFDGEDEEAVTKARSQWADIKARGLAATYWQTDENGRWRERS